MSLLVHYVDEEGNQVRQYQDVNKKPTRVGDPFLIGNGSLVELNVCVFDTKTRGKGHRLEGLRILDLIEYKPPTEAPVEEEKPEITFNVEKALANQATKKPSKKAAPF